MKEKITKILKDKKKLIDLEIKGVVNKLLKLKEEKKDLRNRLEHREMFKIVMEEIPNLKATIYALKSKIEIINEILEELKNE